MSGVDPKLEQPQNGESMDKVGTDDELENDSVPTLDIQSNKSVESEVEAHLESINKAIEEINILSQDFLAARDAFIKAYEVAKARLARIYASNRKAIDKARPFYIARDNAYRSKYAHRRSSVRLKSITEELETAKDIAKKAEESLMSSASSGRGGITNPEDLTDLNKANSQVMDVTMTRDMASRDQMLCMADLSRTDAHLASTAQQLSTHVIKASSYYDTRDKHQRQLDAQYYKLWQKSQILQEAKQRHKDMFTQYSAISTEFFQHKCADDFRSKPPDLSQFEEIDSLDNSFHPDLEDERANRSQSIDVASLHSNSSASDVSTSHVTKAANRLSLDERAITEANDPHEILADMEVSFQLNV